LVVSAAEANGVTLHPVTTASLPDAVLADPMRLRQILLNLLNNALKFTPSGGSVTLLVERDDDRLMERDGDRLAERDSTERVRFVITDTGHGVPPTLRPRLFEDYTQALGDDAAGGTGLGLAISARLAHAMLGTLAHADGPNGSGSCFTLVLPLPSVPRPAAPAATPSSVPPRGLRILVVDDVALNRRTARALLEHAGHTVAFAEDGQAALDEVTREPLPDVVLMDQSMPGMDGNTAARCIRAMNGPAARLPIVAVTANALPEDIEASLAAGMDGHVSKPIELKSLLSAIAEAMDRATMRG
jgi:CheY-like chemotaxis protein